MRKVYLRFESGKTDRITIREEADVGELRETLLTKFPDTLGTTDLSRLSVHSTTNGEPLDVDTPLSAVVGGTPEERLVIKVSPITPSVGLASSVNPAGFFKRTGNPWTTFVADLQEILISLNLSVPTPTGPLYVQKTALDYVHQFLDAVENGENRVLVFDEVQKKKRLFEELIKTKKSVNRYDNTSFIVTGTPPPGKDSIDFDSSVFRATTLALKPLSIRGLMAIFDLKYKGFFSDREDSKLFLDMYTCFGADIALWGAHLMSFFNSDYAPQRKLSVLELEEMLKMVHQQIDALGFEDTLHIVENTSSANYQKLITILSKQGIVSRIRGVNDFLKSITKKKYVTMNNYHLLHAKAIDKATANNTVFQHLAGFALEDLCSRIFDEQLHLRPQDFVAQFFGVQSKARWYLEILDYNNNTDADFLIVEGTTSSEHLLEDSQGCQVIIGNMKHNPHRLMEDDTIKKFTSLINCFREAGFCPMLALFAGEDISKETEAEIVSRWERENVPILRSVGTLPKLLSYLGEKPNEEPFKPYRWNRISEKARIIGSIPKHGTLIVTGPWRAGKTTLLSEMAKELG